MKRREISTQTRRKITIVNEKCCAVCGEQVGPILEIHHLKPVARGGTNAYDNLVGLCPNCHAVIEKCRTRQIGNYKFAAWIKDRYKGKIGKLVSLILREGRISPQAWFITKLREADNEDQS